MGAVGGEVGGGDEAGVFGEVVGDALRDITAVERVDRVALGEGGEEGGEVRVTEDFTGARRGAILEEKGATARVGAEGRRQVAHGRGDGRGEGKAVAG
jgi:hypothetical protein